MLSLLGATLSGVNSTVFWNAYGSKDGVDYARPDRLVIKNIMLGPEAKSDEYNVVQASTTSLTKKIKIPIAVLRVGEVRSMRPHLEFTESPVLLKLIHGDGPVHINGIHLIGDGVGEEMEDEMEFEMMAESEEGVGLQWI